MTVQTNVDAVTDRASTVLWRFGPMIYGPTILFALGEGAVIPLIPIIAAQLGADVATAALVASALVVGQLCGNIPAGWAVARIGERFTMAIAGTLSLVGVVGMVFAPALGVFAASVFLIGFCAAGFGLARHSFMTTRVPLAFRARALSLLGGTFRLGMFIGPFVAAGLLAIFGDEHAAIWFFGACLIATVLLVLLGPDPEKQLADDPEERIRIAEDTGEAVTGAIPTAERIGVFRTMWRFRRVLSRLGPGRGIPLRRPLRPAGRAAAVGLLDRPRRADDRTGRRHLGGDRLRPLLRKRAGHGPVRSALGRPSRNGADGRRLHRPRLHT